MSASVSGWVQFLFSIPVVLWAAWPFFMRGWNSLVSRNLNMYTLIALGIGVAFAYSTVALLAPGLFPADFRDGHGQVGLYFEAAAVIAVLVLLEPVPAENLEVVVPTLTSRDREGEKAILLEKVSVVVGPACPTTKPSECTYATEALTSVPSVKSC